MAYLWVEIYTICQNVLLDNFRKESSSSRTPFNSSVILFPPDFLLPRGFNCDGFRLQTLSYFLQNNNRSRRVPMDAYGFGFYLDFGPVMGDDVAGLGHGHGLLGGLFFLQQGPKKILKILVAGFGEILSRRHMPVRFRNTFDDEPPPVAVVFEAHEDVSPVHSPGIDPSVAVESFRSNRRWRNDSGKAAYMLGVVGVGKTVGIVACLELHDVLDMDVENMLSKGPDGLLAVIRGHLVEVHGIESQPDIFLVNLLEKAEA